MAKRRKAEKEDPDCLWCHNPKNLPVWPIKLGTMPFDTCFVEGEIRVGAMVVITPLEHGSRPIEVIIEDIVEWAHMLKVVYAH